jgi:hypothetical protein
MGLPRTTADKLLAVGIKPVSSSQDMELIEDISPSELARI